MDEFLLRLPGILQERASPAVRFRSSCYSVGNCQGQLCWTRGGGIADLPDFYGRCARTQDHDVSNSDCDQGLRCEYLEGTGSAAQVDSYCSLLSPSGASISSTHAKPCRLRRVQPSMSSPLSCRSAVRFTGDGGRMLSPMNWIDDVPPPRAVADRVAPMLQFGRATGCSVPGLSNRVGRLRSVRRWPIRIRLAPAASGERWNRPAPSDNASPNWNSSFPRSARFSPAASASSQLVSHCSSSLRAIVTSFSRSMSSVAAGANAASACPTMLFVRAGSIMIV